MSENNVWPSKPGVPLNPEREGHHWILTPDGEDAVYLWRPAGECERGRWSSAWVHDVDDWDPREGIYLGPCLAPAEVEALQADLGAQFERAKLSEVLHNQHVTKLEIENARLREALNAADWVIEWTGADLLNGNPYSKVLASYQEYRRTALGETP
jgi:hypothetical protein